MAKQRAVPQMSVRNYVVSLLDVMSQRTELAKWSQVPKEPPSKEFMEALTRTVGTVLGLREYFRKMAHELMQPTLFKSEMKLLSPAQRKEMTELMRFKFQTHFFSDTLIGYSELRVINGMAPLKEVFSILGASGMTVLLGLANGVAVRGAVDVGAGTDAISNECYGPALASVYQIEQHLVDYPRIVVGKQLHLLLTTLAAAPPLGKDLFSANMAKSVLSALFVDDDGAIVFDTLGSVMRESMPSQSMATIIEKARAFVKSEHHRFVASGDHKLALKYARLNRYFDSRPEPWSVSNP